MAPKRGSDGRFRSSGGSVTGGTGDIKPQIMTVLVRAPAGTDSHSVEEITVPRLVMGGRDFTTVMEILKVDWYLGMRDLQDGDSTFYGYLSFRTIVATESATSLASFPTAVANPNVFGAVLINSIFVPGAGGGASVSTLPLSVDMTDSNGNGILVATDRMFATDGAVNNTALTEGIVKILYRMVNITVQEYVGIVQSQSLG